MAPGILNFSTSGSEWSAWRPDRFNPGEWHRYPLDGRLGGS